MNISRILGFLLILNYILPAVAQDASELGRFFTTPAERKQLDQARDQYTSIAQSRDAEAGLSEGRVFPEVQVKGLIVRDDGSSEIWVNDGSTIGKNQLSRELKSSTARVGRQNVKVTLSDGEHVTLKPGQIYSPDTQQVIEAYQTMMPPKSATTADDKLAEDQTTTSEDQVKEGEVEKKDKEFDESVLAETDTKIKLLEERIQKLEGQR